VARVALAAIWLYQGLVPKLLVPDGGELAILAGAGLTPGSALVVLRLLGAAELAFAAALLWWWRSPILLLINVAALVVLGLGAAISAPEVYVAPFNPATLSAAMIALSAVGIVAGRGPLPSARRCRRRPPPRAGEGES
jgi:hypothetical protein